MKNDLTDLQYRGLMESAVEVEVKLQAHSQRVRELGKDRKRGRQMDHRGAGGNVQTEYPEPGAPVTEQGE